MIAGISTVEIIVSSNEGIKMMNFAVTRSIPIGDSDLIFVPRSCYVEKFTFHVT